MNHSHMMLFNQIVLLTLHLIFLYTFNIISYITTYYLFSFVQCIYFSLDQSINLLVLHTYYSCHTLIIIKVLTVFHSTFKDRLL